MRQQITPASALGLLSILSCGCSTTLNEAIGLIGTDEPLPALAIDAQSLLSDEISVRDLDRRHWPMQTVVVPIRQVEHNPAFARSIDWFADGDNTSGTYPTAESALSVQMPGGCTAGCAALELVALPGSWMTATVDAVTAGNRSPRHSESFQRLPSAEPEYAQRWIIRPAPTEGKVAAAD